MPKIRALTGDEPHPDWGGWRKYLNTCDIRGKEDGVIFYGAANCNYILFPCGTLFQNYGDNGKYIMERIKTEGQAEVLRTIVGDYKAIRDIFESIK